MLTCKGIALKYLESLGIPAPTRAMKNSIPSVRGVFVNGVKIQSQISFVEFVSIFDIFEIFQTNLEY